MTKVKKDKNKNKNEELKKGFFNDERFKIIIGLLLVFISLFMTMAFISFLFTWKADQGFSWQNIFSNSDTIVENWAGKTGRGFPIFL